MWPSRARNLAACRSMVSGLRDMLDNVEREDDIERGVRRKRLQLAEMDAASPPPALLHRDRIRLDALDMAERLERIEEQSGAAPDVEDSARRACDGPRSSRILSSRIARGRATTSACGTDRHRRPCTLPPSVAAHDARDDVRRAALWPRRTRGRDTRR